MYMKRISIHLTQRQVDEIQRKATKAGITFAEMVRRLLDQLLQAKTNTDGGG